ncbi:MAG: hypothetical protein ACK5JM_15215, partial [Rhodoblastus sp.]
MIAQSEPGECVRRLLFVISAPDSRRKSSPSSGRKSTYAAVRICGASSDGVAHLVAAYAHSLRGSGYDIERHPHFIDFACGFLALPSQSRVLELW